MPRNRLMKLPTNYGFVHDRHMTLSRVPIVLHTVRGVMYNVVRTLSNGPTFVPSVGLNLKVRLG